MMLIALAVAVSGPGEYFSNMNRYIACLGVGLPADLSHQDLVSRNRFYRSATARCQSERQAAIDAAIREREPGVSQAQAKAQATDIIDTLSPMSSSRKR